MTPEFFAAHPVARSRDRARRTGWASRAGSPTPVYLAEGATHYEPVPWERAFDIIGEELDALLLPDESVFYTLGPDQ